MGRAYSVSEACLSVQGRDETVAVKPGDRAAVFELPLKAGPARLNAQFKVDANRMIGVYYVYVKKL